jgi:hypothetical protein
VVYDDVMVSMLASSVVDSHAMFSMLSSSV